jgi:phosphoglycerol transferase
VKRRRWLGSEAALAVLSAGLALGIAVLALRLWQVDLSIPIRIGADATLHLAFVQNLMESGWYLDGPRLNAPFGQENHDFPQFSDLHFLILRVLAAITGDAVAAVTVFYLLTFPLVAVAMYWALRQLRVPAPVAVFGAVAYAILPYHFTRGTGHLLLSAYYTVPVAGYVLVAAANGTLGRSAWSRGSKSWRTWLRVAVLGLLIGLGTVYYSVFTLVLIVPAALIGYARRRTLSSLAPAAGVALTIVAVLLLSSVPSLIYRSQVGGNVDVPTREPFDSETHALRPVALFLPPPGHRIALFAGLGRRYDGFPRQGERGDPLGIVGAVSLAGLLVLGIGGAAGWRPWRRFGDRLRRIAALALVCFAVAVIGGLATVIALTLTGQLRGWARLSIFIGFFAFLALCMVLGMLWRASRGRRRGVMAVGLAGLLVIAAFDQTNDSMIPDYTALKATYGSQRDFVSAIEADFGPGAAIYQMPYVIYPEGYRLPRTTTDYDHMTQYLQSDTLRWSFGGMKGREAGWQPYVAALPTARQASVIALAGFTGIWVDRLGYYDSGAAVESSLVDLLGQTPSVSPDGRYAMYDLRPYASALRTQLGDGEWDDLASGLLDPVWPRWQSGVDRIKTEEVGVNRLARGSAELALVNDGAADRDVVFSITLRAASAAPITVNLSLPDGTSENFSLTPEPLVVRRPMTLPGGTSDVRLTVVNSTLPFRVSDVWVVDASLAAVAESPPTVP